VSVRTPPPRRAPENRAARIPLPAALSVLSSVTFRRYFIGQTLSGFGNALSTIALAFAVLSITRSAAALSFVLTASRLPQILFVLLGGALGDRFSRRRILLSTDASRALLQALIASLLILHDADLALIAGLQTLSGLGSAMFTPAANGLVNQLAPDGCNREATALLGLATNGAAIGGLAIAGALVGILGPGAAFAVDAATFAASTLSLALIHAPALADPVSRRQGLLGDIGEGWRAVHGTPWLLTHCIYSCLLNTLALSPFFVLGPLVAARSLGGAPAWAAIAIAWAAGSLMGSVLASRWQPKRPVATAIAVSIAIVPILVGLAIPLSLGFLLPAATLLGGENALTSTLILVALQDNIPDRLLARATSFETLGSLIAVPLGMGFAGIVANVTGTRTVLLFAAAWVALSTPVALTNPSVRRLQRTVRRPEDARER
jgi:MFS family permease